MRISTCVLSLLSKVFLLVAMLQGQPPVDPAQQTIDWIEAQGGRVYRGPQQEVDIVAWRAATDTELPLLVALPQLRVLDLDGSAVTDVGLEHLLKLPQLQEVSLRQTRVTAGAAAAFKDRHPGVYRVELSPGFQPLKLLFCAILVLPLLFGGWLIRITQRKQAVLSPQLYARGLAWGVAIVVGTALLLAVAIAQACGIALNVANLFG
jgi:hypothetical protein